MKVMLLLWFTLSTGHVTEMGWAPVEFNTVDECNAEVAGIWSSADSYHFNENGVHVVTLPDGEWRAHCIDNTIWED